jgi:hypothetical protein
LKNSKLYRLLWSRFLIFLKEFWLHLYLFRWNRRCILELKCFKIVRFFILLNRHRNSSKIRCLCHRKSSRLFSLRTNSFSNFHKIMSCINMCFLSKIYVLFRRSYHVLIRECETKWHKHLSTFYEMLWKFSF